jgi:hypothetical protein
VPTQVIVPKPPIKAPEAAPITSALSKKTSFLKIKHLNHGEIIKGFHQKTESRQR